MKQKKKKGKAISYRVSFKVSILQRLNGVEEKNDDEEEMSRNK